VEGLFLLERIDQIDGSEEADLLVVMLHRLDAERRSDVGFAGAWATDQHHVVGALDERAAVKLLDHGLVDLAGRKVEAGQILKGGEAGSLELIGNGPDLPL